MRCSHSRSFLHLLHQRWLMIIFFLSFSTHLVIEGACPNSCNGRGKCVDNVCECEYAFSAAPDCSQRKFSLIFLDYCHQLVIHSIYFSLMSLSLSLSIYLSIYLSCLYFILFLFNYDQQEYAPMVRHGSENHVV
jgi:hypothetical protein